MNLLRRNKRAILMLLVVALVAFSLWPVLGCSRKLPPSLRAIGEEFTVERYMDGRLQWERKFKADSNAGKAIAAILHSKERYRGGYFSFISFAPDIVVRTQTCKLNFQKHRLIVTFKQAGGKPHQLVTDLSAHERRMIENAVK